MRVVAVIQARMSSRRLPGKVMKDLEGKPMLGYLIDRVERARLIDGLVLATSREPSDDPVAAYGEQRGMTVYRGSLDDVAERFLGAVREAKGDAFVRLCGDSPFLDSAVIDKGLEAYVTGNYDYVTNVKPRSYPPGCSVEIASLTRLQECVEQMPFEEREHVFGGFYKREDLKGYNFTHSVDLSSYPLTVDEPSDFERAAKILRSLSRPHHDYGIDEIVEAGERLGLFDGMTAMKP